MRTQLTLLLALIFGMTLLAGCNDGDTTIINQGLDCGLIRDNLVGDWTIDISPGSRTLQNCTGLTPGLGGTTVSINNFPGLYAGMDVFGSDGSTSFKIVGDRTDFNEDPTITQEVTGTVQADSCLALLRVWDSDEDLYLQCIGSFEIFNGTVSGACDSVEIDSDVDGQLDTSCSLSLDLAIDASIN